MITWMLPISYSLLVFALTSFVVAGSTPGSTSSEPDPKLRWPQFYAQEEWQALVLNNNPYLIEDWNEKYWYRLKPIKKKDEKPLWPDDRDLEDIMQFTVSRMQCIMQCLKQHMMKQPIEDDSDESSLSPFEKREKKKPHIYGIHAASYSRFRRAPRGDNELRLQLPEQRRYESVVFHHDLLLEESEGKRFPLEGFWGQSTMLEPSVSDTIHDMWNPRSVAHAHIHSKGRGTARSSHTSTIL